MELDTHDKLNDAIDALNIQYSAVFVPQSQSRNKDDAMLSVNWIVNLIGSGITLSIEYQSGIGNVKGFKHGRVCEFDRLKHVRAAEKGLTINGGKSLPAPLLADVLFSVVMDSEAIEHPDFESWASYFGYEQDSRYAESIYKACVEHGLKLRAMIGDKNLSELRELFSDY